MSRGQWGTDLDDTLDQVDALYAQAQEAIGAYSPETAAGLLDRADALLAGSTDSADSATCDPRQGFGRRGRQGAVRRSRRTVASGV